MAKSATLLDILRFGTIQAALCNPVRIDKPVMNFILSLCLVTDRGAIWLTSKAYDLADKTEAFYLDLDDFGTAKAPEALFSRDWPTFDLVERWAGTSLERIAKEERVFRPFYDPEDRRRGLPAIGNLQGTTALEIRSADQAKLARVVFYATPDYPCSLEVSVDGRRCDAILERMVGQPPLGRGPTLRVV